MRCQTLSGILESLDLHQYVDFPTHIHSHSLDLIICSSGCNVLSLSAFDLISGHFSVVADLQIPSNHIRTIPQAINYRNLQSINMEAFKPDIKNSNVIRYALLLTTPPEWKSRERSSHVFAFNSFSLTFLVCILYIVLFTRSARLH